MSYSRFEAFIEAAISKTKTGVLTWERADIKRFNEPAWTDYDLGRSFMCAYAGGKLLLTCKKGSGAPWCFISPDKGLPFQRIVGSGEDDGAAIVLRLYNLVYSSFPSVDSFIDAMINSVDEPDDLPF
ncbi:MAG: hypothetical protein HDT16_02050 [Oscillibacter sp.]|nr:hypothetical protein [Oscillibacter sp.]